MAVTSMMRRVGGAGCGRPWAATASLVLAFVCVFLFARVDGMSTLRKRQLADKAKEMFYHGYNAYMDHAYPADELMPLSCTGRVRGVTRSRGDADDALGRFSLTLVDTLDTLLVFGNVSEFIRASEMVARDVSFATDIVVSTFETNIRVLGGLIAAHALFVDEVLPHQTSRKERRKLRRLGRQLLDKAIDLGNRLLKAFDTKTGMPYSRINLLRGITAEVRRNDITCTACAGTLIMEFGALSRLTGDVKYERAAKRALAAIWSRRGRQSNLVGTTINITSGVWHRTDAGIGAGIDSYYEYLLKAYVLLGDETYLSVFNTHYAAIMQHLKRGPFIVDAHLHSPNTLARKFMDSLQTFWPGLQVLKGDILAAMETHRMYNDIIERHQFIPEAFFADFRPNWAQYPLRPEFVESTYFLYRATGDPVYLTVGERMLDALEKHSRVSCGFAAIKDVRSMQKEDQMDSFMLAETLKYLYLLFAEPEDVPIDLDNYVFTTEAHLLPLSLAMRGGNEEPFDRHHRYDVAHAHDFSCEQHRNELRNFLRLLHIHLPPFEPVCVIYDVNLKPPSKRTRTRNAQPTKPPQVPSVQPAELDVNDPDYVAFLQSIGISVVQAPGTQEVRLVFHGDLENSEDHEGAKFMKELLRLQNESRMAEDRGKVQVEVTVVRRGDSVSEIVEFSGGPAHFGPNLDKAHFVAQGRVVLASPATACRPLSERVDGKLVLAHRGGCMFVDKVRMAAAAGAVGVIIADNSSQGTEEALLSMSGDGRDDVSIPSVFVHKLRGDAIQEALSEEASVTATFYGKRWAS